MLSQVKRQAVGVYGYLCLLAWAAVMPGLVPGARVGAVLATVGLLSWLLGTRAWRSLASGRTWLFLGSLVALASVAGRWRGGPGTVDGLVLGLHMAARALSILLAVDTLAAHVPVAELAGLFEGLGLAGLGFALGVAFNLLPALRRTARNVLDALRLRGGPWRHPVRAWRLAAVTILTLTLARGQEIADAAEARGYAPGRAPCARPRCRGGDVLLALGLSAWGLLLALV